MAAKKHWDAWEERYYTVAKDGSKTYFPRPGESGGKIHFPAKKGSSMAAKRNSKGQFVKGSGKSRAKKRGGKKRAGKRYAEGSASYIGSRKRRPVGTRRARKAAHRKGRKKGARKTHHTKMHVGQVRTITTKKGTKYHLARVK